MELTFRPITTWPGTITRSRARSKFRAGYSDTLKLLKKELHHLRAKNIVLQVAMSESDIRLDGRPRAGSKVAHPGVVLSFDSKHGPLSYPCDTFSEWEDNLRAIALGLEHLRAVDRYGITQRGEQYRGWTALPAPKNGATMTKEEAVKALQGYVSFTITSKDEALAAWRQASFRAHPDRGGDAEEFKKLQRAKEVLGL